ncbi:MAG: hypothetical protein LBJ82_06835 [Deltaproteobacteria bacterium]|jgi:hypothetical protein|nr:hypothetical protein [Deltaproteobacteria bacterium]
MPKAPVLEKLDTHVADLDIHGNMPGHNTSSSAHANLFGPVNSAISALQGQVGGLTSDGAGFSSGISAINGTLTSLSGAVAALQGQVSGITQVNSGYFFAGWQTPQVETSDEKGASICKLAIDTYLNTEIFPVGFLFINYAQRGMGETLRFVWRAAGAQGTGRRSQGLNPNNITEFSFTFPENGYYMFDPGTNASAWVWAAPMLWCSPGPGLNNLDYCLARTHGPSIIQYITPSAAPDTPPA